MKVITKRVRTESAQDLVDTAREPRQRVNINLLNKTLGRKVDKKKVVLARARQARGFLTLLTGNTQKGIRQGRGRPSGTYKYGMPIHIYKKLLQQRRAQYEQFKQQQLGQLSARGLTPEQVQQAQLMRTLQEQQQVVPQRVQQMPAQYPNYPQQFQSDGDPRVADKRLQQFNHQRKMMELRGLSDDDLRFRKFMSENDISPNTQNILNQIRSIQNKGARDNIEQQRRIAERRLVGNSMNLMKAHENMIPVRLDVTGVSSENILMAPSIFKEDPNNNILRPKRLNLMQTREAGNNLRFF